VKVRYKQTLLGAAWAILQPALMMVVFTIFFSRLAQISSGDLPYPVFVYAGLLPWTFFATAIANAGNSVVGSEQLISKVYFPRLVIPFASVGAAVVDFGFAFSLLVMLMLYYGIAPGMGVLLVPLLVTMAVLAALGVGTLLAALNVAYRDFRYVIPFLVQFWMFATPTVYMQIDANGGTDAAAAGVVDEAAADARVSEASAAQQPQRLPRYLRSILAVNPMTGLIQTFRIAVLGGPIPWRDLAASASIIVVLFYAGCLYFRRVEDRFADII
jgi:lipopolysaccharide transport system permease protein